MNIFYLLLNLNIFCLFCSLLLELSLDEPRLRWSQQCHRVPSLELNGHNSFSDCAIASNIDSLRFD